MRLGTLFSDGAVLQQGRINPLWGETLPGLLIEAHIAGKTAYAKASNDGHFMIHLPPLPAGGPYELQVSAVENQAERITVKDVLVGEVWLCSGQSNMQYNLGADWAPDKENRVNTPLSRQQEKELLETVRDPDKFRFITVPMKVTGCREQYFEGQWHCMNPEHAPDASAVGAWFGLELRRKLKVPVGLICCSWGGSIAETWISPAALRTDPNTRPLLEEWETFRAEKEAWDPSAVMNELLKPYADPGISSFAQGWAAPEFDDVNWAEITVPGSWIRQGIASNGAVWIRKQVILPPELAGKDLVLNTGAIDKHDITFFNGVEIGRTGKDFEIQYFDRPRCYNIPGNLVKAGVNTIAIRAFSFMFDGSFMGKQENWTLAAPDRKIPLAGSWKAKAEFDWGTVNRVSIQRGIANHNTPGLQFDSMIRPLLPCALRGVIWYQGESNAKSISQSKSYRQLMELLIRDWRFHFEQPDLPFIQVQLADYREHTDYEAFSNWAVLRDSQRRVCGSLPNVHLITALDTGEEEDIHPQNKKDVGLRLAASALHHVYGQENILPSGPVFWKAVSEGNALRVFFHFTEEMELRGKPGSSFYLAGADGHYYPADTAEISGDSILLTSSQVKNPLSVRYAWADNPNNILYNQQFPAASFSSENQ